MNFIFFMPLTARASLKLVSIELHNKSPVDIICSQDLILAQYPCGLMQLRANQYDKYN